MICGRGVVRGKFGLWGLGSTLPSGAPDLGVDFVCGPNKEGGVMHKLRSAVRVMCFRDGLAKSNAKRALLTSLTASPFDWNLAANLTATAMAMLSSDAILFVFLLFS